MVINRRATGPDFDQIVEVPEIIQKVLEYDRGPELAILELYQPQTPQKYNKTLGKNKNSLKLFPPIEPL